MRRPLLAAVARRRLASPATTAVRRVRVCVIYYVISINDGVSVALGREDARGRILYRYRVQRPRVREKTVHESSPGV